MYKSEEIIEFKTPPKVGLARIPRGYFFKGGAAREVLRRMLRPNQPRLLVRDIDVIRFVETDDSLDHKVALELMPDDYEFGRGVEVVTGEDEYFLTRDLTVNEVYCNHSVIRATSKAVHDLRNGILRPTPHVTSINGEVDCATALKILRFAAECLVKGVNCTVVNLPALPKANPFYIALNLDRSFAISKEVGEEYLTLAWQFQAIFAEQPYAPPLEVVVKYLVERIPQGLRIFRNLDEATLGKIASQCALVRF